MVIRDRPGAVCPAAEIDEESIVRHTMIERAKAPDRGARQEVARRERAFRLGHRKISHLPRVDRRCEEPARRIERGRELSGVIRSQFPDLVDLTLRIDAVEIEAGHREDRGRGRVRVLQEVAAALAGRESRGQRLLA